jgi:hypothetical protein
MANIIDTTYFVNEIEIANVNQNPVKADLINSIKLYEKEVLVMLLGYPLYVELMTNLATSGDKWDKLLNGEDFSFILDGVTINTRWEGLKGVDKVSVLAYYIYYKHREKRASYTAGLATEVEASTENAKPTAMYHKMVDVWNRFIDMYGQTWDDYFYPESAYPTDALPSAYNYLLAKKADFPTWQYQDLGGYLNKFGI